MEIGKRKDRGAKGAFIVLAATLICAPPPAFAQTAGVLGVRFGGDSTTTRVVIDLAAPAGAPALSRDGEGRLTLDLAAGSRVEPNSGPGRGLVTGWSASETPAGTRLRFDLATGTKLAHRFMIPSSATVAYDRYVIDLAAAAPLPVVSMAAAVTLANEEPPPRMKPAPVYDEPTLLAPSRVTRTAVSSRREEPAVAPRSRGERRPKVVVIDAGHGGHDSGALGATRQEKDLTLPAALALKGRLERTGRYKVILTRDSDTFVPLEDRVKIARSGGADLFISLHADSAGGDAATHGASVYTLSDSGGGRVHSVLGRNEWFSKVANRADAGTSQILLDLTQRSTRNRSAVFADLLLDRLAGKVDLLPRSHRDAGYFVLLAPDVPAALLEMGFITNPEDEARLADPKARSRMMEGVADAIDAYFAATPRMVAG